MQACPAYEQVCIFAHVRVTGVVTGVTIVHAAVGELPVALQHSAFTLHAVPKLLQGEGTM